MNLDQFLHPEYYKIAIQLAIIAVAAWFLVRLVKRIEVNKKSKQIALVLRGLILISSLLVALQTVGVSISAVLAFGGIGGIAIGFAAKDILANFLGGFTVYFDRPFTEGDWIRSPDREIEGIVEHIGWRHTRIRTLDKRPLYVPNSLFTTITIENPSRMSHRKIKETIGVRYSDFDQLEVILAEIREMLNAHPEVDTRQTILVHLNQFGSSSLDILVSAYTKTTQLQAFMAIKEDVLMKIHAIITSHNAEIAFPTTTFYLPNVEENPLVKSN